MLGKTKSAKFFRLALFSAFFAYSGVLLGAFSRLSDAGLGCPDWPGCYGKLFAPTTPQDIVEAKQYYVERTAESPKAWKDMMHRYIAGTLGLLIVRLAVLGWQLRKRHRRQQYVIPAIVMALVFFQALLGMLTVTLQVKPLVVMAQLIAGLSALGLLWWVILREQRFWRPAKESDVTRSLRPRALLALAFVVGQIILGGWTSANYAPLVCPDFPTCQGTWWPAMDFVDGFTLWRGLGISYHSDVLTLAAATAIHMAHRLGAVIALLYVGWLSLRVIRTGDQDHLRRYGLLVLAVLLVQMGLGITNVVTHLPLVVGVAHDAVAALLLLSLITLNHVLRPRKA